MINHKISVMDLQRNVLTPEEFNKKYMNQPDQLLGVVVQTEILGLVLSTVQWKDVKWSDNTDELLTEAQNESLALQTISGYKHTREIVTKLDGKETDTAAQKCWNYTAGGLKWYLPSVLELATIYAFKDEINEVLRQIDDESEFLPDDDWFWSSSEYSQHNAWYVGFGNGYIYGYGKYNTGYVRAVAAFSSLAPSASLLSGEPSEGASKSNVPGTVEQFCGEMTDEQLVAILRERGFNGTISKSITL